MQINATIITIGDEILNGDTIDTNSVFLAKELNLLGINVHKIISISDTEETIKDGLRSASHRADVIFLTGGLGPTKDDVTKKSIASFFNVECTRSNAIFSKLEDYYNSRNREFRDIHKTMADMPTNATVLNNSKGTAAGMLFKENGKIYVSMPGVPHEMKAIFTEEVIDILKENLELPTIVHRYFMTAGRGETQLAAYIEDIEDKLPNHLKIAYLPSIGLVKIRLTGQGDNKMVIEADIAKYGDEIQKRISNHYYSNETLTHAAAIGEILVDRKLQLATAESCTGGNIAHKITENPGSSQYFNGGVVAYSNTLKESLLGVEYNTLLQHGAVSEATIKEMIAGVLANLGADVAIATSGISGPSGGSAAKPVGTVWIAVGNNEEIVAKKFNFALDRQKHIEFSSVTALEMLRRFLLGTLNKE